MAAENHAKIVRSFWNDPEIKKLSRDEAHLLLYFFSGPHGNMIGLYGIPLEYAAREAKFTVDEVRRAIAGPLAQFVTYDSTTEEIFVHASARHQIGEELRVSASGKEDNRIENVRKLVRAIHSPVLQRMFLVRYNSAFNLCMQLPDARRGSEGASRRGFQGASKSLRRDSKKGLARGSAEAPTLAPSKPDTETEAETEAETGWCAPTSPTRGGWPGRLHEIFKPIGLFAPPMIGSLLKPAVEEYGEEQVVKAAECYVRRLGDGDKPQFLGPQSFAKRAGYWVGEVKPIDLYGTDGGKSPEVLALEAQR